MVGRCGHAVEKHLENLVVAGRIVRGHVVHEKRLLRQRVPLGDAHNGLADACRLFPVNEAQAVAGRVVAELIVVRVFGE